MIEKDSLLESEKQKTRSLGEAAGLTGWCESSAPGWPQVTQGTGGGGCEEASSQGPGEPQAVCCLGVTVQSCPHLLISTDRQPEASVRHLLHTRLGAFHSILAQMNFVFF